MRYLASTVVLIGALRPSAAAYDDGDVGIDHMYNDISSFPFASNDTADCFAACAAIYQCVGWVVTPSGECSGSTNATCYLKSLMGPVSVNSCRISGFMPGALRSSQFVTLPVGAVQPSYWLADELNLQAAGLTGYLSMFWPDIENSTWIGGSADGDLHERTPYWLNGLVPLSYLTGDASLAVQRDRYLQYIMDHQAPSGWLGPDDMPDDGDEYWSRFNVLLSLLQYYEASGDARAIACVFNYLGEARRRMLGATQLSDWSVVRAQDFIMALWWLVDRFAGLSGVPAGYNEAFLIDLADITHAQMLANGGDWKTWFDTDVFPTGPACVPNAPCNMLTHGVNIGQAIKSEAVWYRRSDDLTDVASTYIRMRKLDVYHGVPSGMYQADEHLAGAVPSHGTETCAVVESIVSYAEAGAIIGDALFFERAERIVYNAMPAAATKDLWERVYLQSSNEFGAVHQDPHPWITDGPDSGTYSLQGNFGCCTANMHAGWPKFTQRAVGTVPATHGVAVLMWAPLNASTPNATVVIDTYYPFGDNATVIVTPTAAAAGRDVPVQLRIPSWAGQGSLRVNDGPLISLAGSNGSFYKTTTVAGAATTFTLQFSPSIRLEEQYDGAVAVARGALVYTLWVGQQINVTAQYAFKSQDLAITATQPWNMALVISDRSDPAADLQFVRVSENPPAIPFGSTLFASEIQGYGRQVAGWTAVNNAPDAPPPSPACATSGACGPLQKVTLVPFGSTHVRMTVLPTA